MYGPPLGLEEGHVPRHVAYLPPTTIDEMSLPALALATIEIAVREKERRPAASLLAHWRHAPLRRLCRRRRVEGPQPREALEDPRALLRAGYSRGWRRAGAPSGLYNLRVRPSSGRLGGCPGQTPENRSKGSEVPFQARMRPVGATPHRRPRAQLMSLSLWRWRASDRLEQATQLLNAFMAGQECALVGGHAPPLQRGPSSTRRDASRRQETALSRRRCTR